MWYLSLLCVLVLSSGDAFGQSGWKQASGPEGGNVRSVAASADGRQVVAGFWNGAIYRISPESPSWKPLAEIVGLVSLTAQGNILFAQSYSGLYQSYDFGSSWVPVVRGTSNTVFSPIIRGRDGLYFIANDSVYRSIDAGDSWTFTGSTGQSATEIGYSGEKAEESALIAANGFSGVFASSDKGVTWMPSQKGLPADPVIWSMVTVASEGKYSVWACVKDQGVYYTDNGGKDWDKECDGLPEYGSGYPNFTKLVEADGTLLGITDHSVYEYSFEEETWKKANHLLGKNIQAYGGKLYSTSMDGVELSTDGGNTWSNVGVNFFFTTVRDFAASAKGVLAAAENGVFRTIDGGNEWTKTGAFYSEDLAAASGIAYAGSLEGVRRSTDDGLTWELRNTGITEDLNHLSSLSTNESAVFAGFYDVFGFHGNSHWNSGGVYRSTDAGSTWQAVNSGLSNDGFAYVPVIKLEAFNDVQFALALDGLYRSTNNGDQWTQVKSIDPTSDMLVDLARVGDVLLVASMRSMYRSTDAGVTWLPYSSGLQEQLENHEALLTMQDTVFLKSYTTAGEPKTYMLSGDEWVLRPIKGLETVDVTKVFAWGTMMYAGTDARSVWTREFTPQASVEHEMNAKLFLSTYPNPFAKELHVSFTLSEPTQVRVGLYDVSGALVSESHEAFMPQGVHTLQIPAAHHPNGMYICRFGTEEGSIQKQVVLLR